MWCVRFPLCASILHHGGSEWVVLRHCPRSPNHTAESSDVGRIKEEHCLSPMTHASLVILTSEWEWIHKSTQLQQYKVKRNHQVELQFEQMLFGFWRKSSNSFWVFFAFLLLVLSFSPGLYRIPQFLSLFCSILPTKHLLFVHSQFGCFMLSVTMSSYLDCAWLKN